MARAVLLAAVEPVRQLLVAGFGAALKVNDLMMPRVVDAELGTIGNPVQRTDEPKTARGPDSLFEPSPGPGEVRGGWGGRARNLYTTLQLNPTIRRAAIGGAALAGFALARSRANGVA